MLPHQVKLAVGSRADQSDLLDNAVFNEKWPPKNTCLWASGNTFIQLPNFSHLQNHQSTVFLGKLLDRSMYGFSWWTHWTVLSESDPKKTRLEFV